MTEQLEHQADDVAALLIAGDHPTAERAIDALRELAWRRRAGEVRARRHAGPGVRGAVLGRATLRRKPRARGMTAGEASDVIAVGRRGA